jgi:hypothetical protein
MKPIAISLRTKAVCPFPVTGFARTDALACLLTSYKHKNQAIQTALQPWEGALEVVQSLVGEAHAQVCKTVNGVRLDPQCPEARQNAFVWLIQA